MDYAKVSPTKLSPFYGRLALYKYSGWIGDKMRQDQHYEEIVRQAQNADDTVRRELVDQLVAQFTDAAYQWALLVLEDEEKASDALQEAWIAAFLHIDQLRESKAFPAWFRQLVLNSCYHTIRDEKPALPIPDQLPADSEPDPGDEIESLDRSERVRDAVLALPEHERVVTELYYFDDYPQQEIAEVLSVPLTTVKKRLQYARQRLKGMIQPDIVSALPMGQLQVSPYQLALYGGCTGSAVYKFYEEESVLIQQETVWEGLAW
jgi:RNA polymerase sigma factor (sigma-70 family)